MQRLYYTEYTELQCARCSISNKIVRSAEQRLKDL